jgi:hypothetical protein
MPQSSRKSQKLWLAGWLLHAVGTWMHHLPALLQPCPHRQLAGVVGVITSPQQLEWSGC